MTSGQLIAILLITFVALALVLLPVRRRRVVDAAGDDVATATARRQELLEEKAAVYRALRELAFDHEAGYLSDEDHRVSRERYEARAAEIVHALDALPEAPGEARPPALPSPGAAARRSARVAIAVGGVVLLLAAGVAAGLFASRARTPEPARARAPLPLVEERSSAPATAAPAPATGSGPRGAAPGREALTGMLEAARQHLNQGRYKEALAGYEAVLREEPGNVDARTHISLILAIGGHADSALERLDQIIAANPDYALAYFFRGQVLFRARQDYAGAIRDWERYLELVPSGTEQGKVTAFLKEARARQRQ